MEIDEEHAVDDAGVLLQKDEVNSIDRHDLSYTIAIIKYLAGGFSAILFFLFVKISFNGILVPIIIFTLMLSGILKYNNF